MGSQLGSSPVGLWHPDYKRTIDPLGIYFKSLKKLVSSTLLSLKYDREIGLKPALSIISLCKDQDGSVR